MPFVLVSRTIINTRCTRSPSSGSKPLRNVDNFSSRQHRQSTRPLDPFLQQAFWPSTVTPCEELASVLCSMPEALGEASELCSSGTESVNSLDRTLSCVSIWSSSGRDISLCAMRVHANVTDRLSCCSSQDSGEPPGLGMYQF